MPRTTTLAVVVLLLVAGCAGSPGGSPTSPRTETNTQMPTATSASPNAPSNTHSTNTVEFETLTDRQQEAFLEARDGAVSFGPTSPHIEAYPRRAVSTFADHQYVRYGGECYRVEVDTRSNRYMSWTVRMDPETPTGNGSVVAFANLSKSSQELAERVIEGNYGSSFDEDGYRTSWVEGGDIPDVFTYSYIRYENQTYAPTVTGSYDAQEHLLTVTEYGTCDFGGR